MNRVFINAGVLLLFWVLFFFCCDVFKEGLVGEGVKEFRAEFSNEKG